MTKTMKPAQPPAVHLELPSPSDSIKAHPVFGKQLEVSSRTSTAEHIVRLRGGLQSSGTNPTNCAGQ